MPRLDWLRTRSAAFLHDILMIPVAWLSAWWLRYNLGAIPADDLAVAVAIVPGLILIQAPVFYYFGLYRGVWRFASLPDLVRIIKAVVAGLALCTALLFLFNRLEGVPRAVLPVYGLLLAVALGGPRLLYRWSKDKGSYRKASKRSLIVGAGRAGEMIVRDLLRDPNREYVPVAFVDDDRGKQCSDVHGIRVVGRCVDIPKLVRELEIELILLAIPSASALEMRRIVGICEEADVEFRTLPRLQDFTPRNEIVDSLREVSIDDLLGREQIELDWRAIRGGISGRTVVVTGGGGSIGAELCRQIARVKPRALVIFELSEFALYSIDQELRDRFPDLTLYPVLGDVSDAAAVDRLLKDYQPDVVFHAAAYKHVPMLQRHIREAVRNNILGTRTIAEAVARHHVEVFVLISTDKAVNPVNVLGATKRVAELVCQMLTRRSASRFITVRFGNVLGSAGSVVPRFQQQVRMGGPVTVTHPEVTRYFMTIPEACQLILQAEVMGAGGEVFLLDMGEPVKIRFLAEQMIRLAGKTLEEMWRSSTLVCDLGKSCVRSWCIPGSNWLARITRRFCWRGMRIPTRKNSSRPWMRWPMPVSATTKKRWRYCCIGWFPATESRKMLKSPRRK